MTIIISKRFTQKPNIGNSQFDDYKVVFDWLAGDDISIQTMINNECLSETRQKAKTLDFALRSFNAGWGGNDRETFKKLLRCNNKAEFSSIARVIGITNGLCHYFSNYDLNEYNIGFLLSSMEEARGFVFVDWDTVSVGGRNSNNQLVYLSSAVQESAFGDELQSLYELGFAGTITVDVGRNTPFKCFYFESKDLNNPQTKRFRCVEAIIRTINESLSKKLR